MVEVKTMERFASKCISMGLAVPMAKLFCREVNAAICGGLGGSKHVSLSVSLRSEVEFWRFLDSWKGYARLGTERHGQVVVCSDTSLYKYGGRVEYEGEVRLVISGNRMIGQFILMQMLFSVCC